MPMFDQVWTLGAQNNKLREARDLLLPRLISGELPVDQAPWPDTLDLESTGEDA